MSQRKIPGKAALITALKETSGNMAATARRFHCDRSLVWQRVNEDAELRALVTELSENFIDEAEQTLYAAIREGNIAATIFFLKCQAKHRGWSERMELLPLQMREIEVELGGPSISTTDQTATLNGHGAASGLLGQ